MIVENGGSTSMKRYVHPRIEPEMAYLLKRELVGTLTPMQALSAVEAIAPAVEIIDSRYKAFKLSLTDVGRGQLVVLRLRGRPVAQPGISIARNLGIVVSFNGVAGARRLHGGDPGQPVALARRRRRFAASRRTAAAGMDRHGGGREPCRGAQRRACGSTARFSISAGAGSSVAEWEPIMPIAIIHMMEGRDDQKKARAIAAVTQAIIETLDAKPESVRVIFCRNIRKPTGASPASRSGRRRQERRARRTK